MIYCQLSKNMKKYIFIIITLLYSVSAFSQESAMRVSAPSVVAVGEPFKVEFSLENSPTKFIVPDFEGFDMVAGPTMSSSTSISIINGKRETSSAYIYTCVLIAQKKGNLFIGQATAYFGSKVVKSRALPMEAVANRDSGGSTTQQQGGQKVSADDILLLMSVNKTKAYIGEALIVTLKLATRVELVGVEAAKYPSFNGFWTQELPIAENEPWNRENINDKIYETRILRKYILFPQNSGELAIDKMSMEIVARIVMDSPAQRRSIFDDFFGGGVSTQNIKRKVETRRIDIAVSELPTNAPFSFNGAVGDFSINSKLSSDMLSANSSGNIELVISGNGNMPLISEPKFALPNSFELYTVKSQDEYKVTSQGAIGKKIFEYPFIARAAGKYEIPAVEFSYFNPQTKKYKTISTKAMEIGIAVDTTANEEVGTTRIFTGVTKEELKILGNDIRYIETSYPEFTNKGDFYISSFMYFFNLILAINAALCVFWSLKRKLKYNSDVVRVRSSKARKIAVLRVKGAKSFMDSGNESQFYQATLQAMWGYISDKLNIELALLSKSNVSDALSIKGVDNDLITKYINIIEKCEMAQYAPVTDSSMSDIYNNSIEIISNLEDKI